MILCPFCDGQGAIYRAKVIKNNMQIFICDECDTMWLNSDINENNCISFEDFMSELELKPLWSELCNITKL